MRDLWSLEVQRDLIKWVKECEDRAHKKRAGDREHWKREQSQIEDRLVCRKWRAARWEGEVAGGKERKSERDRKGKRKKKRGRVKRSWSGYETNSDLIWRVYDSVFAFFFQAPRCRLELRLGGGLGWAQREKRDWEMVAYCTVLSSWRNSSVCLCTAAGWGWEFRQGNIQLHSVAPSSTWAWITEVL